MISPQRLAARGSTSHIDGGRQGDLITSCVHAGGGSQVPHTQVVTIREHEDQAMDTLNRG